MAGFWETEEQTFLPLAPVCAKSVNHASTFRHCRAVDVRETAADVAGGFRRRWKRLGYATIDWRLTVQYEYGIGVLNHSA
jgi:hypothetical protein